METEPVTGTYRALPDVAQQEAPPTERPVITTLAKTLFVDAVKDFFMGIFNFFRRYSRHYRYCFTYVWKPSLRHGALRKLDWKENSQQSFELSLLVLFALIFMVKLDWIPKSPEYVMDMLGDDLSQMGLEAVLFFALAATYIVFVSLSIFTGRLLRQMFYLPISRIESDILYAYLNNVIFSITVIFAFLLRLLESSLTLGGDDETFIVALWVLFFLIYLPLVLVWSIRFCKTNGISGKKKLGFVCLIAFPFALFYSYESCFVTQLLFNI
ncbi:MAG TPA: hypothetical protein VM843_04170 [Flavisolibacter sp.]|jgi:hypothetical protein|nr:hypothetical protein [Flavisolibacter sp.]